jgi:hypothetical protein
MRSLLQFTHGANKSQIESCHSRDVIFLTVEGVVNRV